MYSVDTRTNVTLAWLAGQKSVGFRSGLVMPCHESCLIGGPEVGWSHTKAALVRIRSFVNGSFLAPARRVATRVEEVTCDAAL